MEAFSRPGGEMAMVGRKTLRLSSSAARATCSAMPAPCSGKAARTLTTPRGQLDAIVRHVPAEAEQKRQTGRFAGVGLAAGILLWSILPGTIAHAMPESWQWPERMALTDGAKGNWRACYLGRRHQVDPVSSPGSLGGTGSGATCLE